MGVRSVTGQAGSDHFLPPKVTWVTLPVFSLSHSMGAPCKWCSEISVSVTKSDFMLTANPAESDRFDLLRSSSLFGVSALFSPQESKSDE